MTLGPGLTRRARQLEAERQRTSGFRESCVFLLAFLALSIAAPLLIWAAAEFLFGAR